MRLADIRIHPPRAILRIALGGMLIALLTGCENSISENNQGSVPIGYLEVRVRAKTLQTRSFIDRLPVV